MEDLPVYLFSASLDRMRRETVHVNIRLSRAPEDTALLNEIPLDKLREIFVNRFKFTPEQVDQAIEKMRHGHGFSGNLSMTEEDLYRTRLLAKHGSD